MIKIRLATKSKCHKRKYESKTSRLCAFVATLFLFVVFPSFAQESTQSLNANWKFSESGKNEWLAATVPGTIHTDLLANGKIPDPYIGTNESKVQWVETKTWEYRTLFNVEDSIWKSERKELVFEGLDTYAQVYLNDELILTAENMFISYHIENPKGLKQTNNLLRIIFHPVSELIKQNKTKETLTNLPGGDRVFIRKAQYQFGWDWGPKIVTSGIWKTIHLNGFALKIENLTLLTDSIKSDTAYLTIHGTSDVTPLNSLKMEVTIDGKKYLVTKVVSETYNQFSFAIKVPHPKLWWCNGMGKANLYEFIFKFSFGKLISEKKMRSGIRTVQLNQKSDDSGNNFSFVLNGEPVFAKGANWIPNDNFLPRVTSEKYYSLIKSTQQSNMNMLRVWGGGVYEDDHFYDDCDSLGIMVWQDFMFAGGIYPTSADFTNLVEDEVISQFERLNKHPSIMLWCGNNEISEGWNNWGWQKENKINATDSATLWKAQTHFFNDMVPNAIRAADKKIIYISSSPSTGWGHPEAYRSGDVHYWGVWWGNEPFSSYDTHVGRFMSEYGFQATPPLSSFALFDLTPNISLTDSTVLAHQKHSKGFETISEYMTRDYPRVNNFSDYVYISQVVQLDGISRAIEDHRRAMPYCMGTLFWQYNDCWPGTSWSSVDYYGQKKLLQYKLKELYAPVAISTINRNDSILIYLINDDTISHKGLLAFAWFDFSGKIYRTSFTPSEIYTGSSKIAIGFDQKQFYDSLKPENGVLRVVFNYENGKDVTVNHFFSTSKNLKLDKDPGLVTDLVADPDKAKTYHLTLRTVKLIKNVYISINDPNATFSDNGFDMLAGETKEVIINSSLSLQALQQQLKIQMMNNL